MTFGQARMEVGEPRRYDRLYGIACLGTIHQFVNISSMLHLQAVDPNRTDSLRRNQGSIRLASQQPAQRLARANQQRNGRHADDAQHAKR